MQIKAILKEIKVKNTDTDTEASVKFDIYLKKTDLNELANLSLKELKLTIEK